MSSVRPDDDRTVNWSNFDPDNLNTEYFSKSKAANPCGRFLKWKITPKNPPADKIFMVVMAMVLPWKIAKDFQNML